MNRRIITNTLMIRDITILDVNCELILNTHSYSFYRNGICYLFSKVTHASSIHAHWYWYYYCSALKWTIRGKLQMFENLTKNWNDDCLHSPPLLMHFSCKCISLWKEGVWFLCFSQRVYSTLVRRFCIDYEYKIIW